MSRKRKEIDGKMAGEEKLFKGMSAFFSASVSVQLKRLWFANGGQLETLMEADYVFSDKFEPGLIYGTSKYSHRYPVALFHPKYIEDCLVKGDMRAIPVGHYQLLPDHVRELVEENFPGLLRQTSGQPH